VRHQETGASTQRRHDLDSALRDVDDTLTIRRPGGPAHGAAALPHHCDWHPAFHLPHHERAVRPGVGDELPIGGERRIELESGIERHLSPPLHFERSRTTMPPIPYPDRTEDEDSKCGDDRWAGARGRDNASPAVARRKGSS